MVRPDIVLVYPTSEAAEELMAVLDVVLRRMNVGMSEVNVVPFGFDRIEAATNYATLPSTALIVIAIENEAGIRQPQIERLRKNAHSQVLFHLVATQPSERFISGFSAALNRAGHFWVYCGPQESAPRIALIWNPELLTPEQYAELVTVIGDVARSEGAAGLERIRSNTFGVSCEAAVPR